VHPIPNPNAQTKYKKIKTKCLEDKHGPYHDKQHKVHPIPKPHLFRV
jgi:hypothetical protein